jgi:hypothetical protein
MNESSQDVETVKYMAELEDVNEQVIHVSNMNSNVFETRWTASPLGWYKMN